MKEIEDALRKWNPWWGEKGVDESIRGIHRIKTSEVIDVLNLRHIKDIIGVRRSGKTTLLYQVIDELINKGIDPEKIVFINFDDPTLNIANLDDTLKTIYKINPDIEYLFLDEASEKRGWERWVRTIYDLKKFKQIFVTGSSATLLSKEVGKVLTGRHISFVLFPFSFKEFLIAHDWKKFDRNYLLAEREKILHFLFKYLKSGGFPETLKKDESESKRILTNVYNDIIARDIVSRYDVDAEKVNRLAYYLLTSFTSEYSYSKVARNVGIDWETAERYVEFLKDAFLVFSLDMFSFKVRTQFKRNKKIYCVDTGLRNAVSFRFLETLGRLAENVVFIELKRRGKDVYYWKSKGGKEIDFVVKKGLNVCQLIQVCWNIEKERTKKREIESLLKGMEKFKLKEGVIITEDKEGEEVIDGKKIKYIPLWYWLLDVKL